MRATVVIILSILLLLIISIPSSFAESFPAKPGEYVVEVAENGGVLGFNSENLGDKFYKIQLLGNFSEGGNTDGCEAIKRDIPEVIACSPNYIVGVGAVPNDPSFSETWGLTSLYGSDAESAWDITQGNGDVVVAVVDTGVDYNHPDLVQNMWTNPRESQNGIDDDGNGLVDDIYGYNAYSNNGNPMDDHNHGTHCAGTIGARGNNGIGVAGVSWNVKIMGIKFMGSNGSGDLSGAIRGINYVVDQKRAGVNVRVMSNSWGGGGYSETLERAIQRAANEGILFVAAAGNSAMNNDSSPTYPASYEVSNVISVAAVQPGNTIASFSNYGSRSVDIAAPGVSILSTLVGGGYGRMSGTSMATPHVAGALGLLLSYDGSLSVDAAKARLLSTGIPTEALQGRVADGRLLNVRRLITQETSTPNFPTCDYKSESISYNPDNSIWRVAPESGSNVDDGSIAKQGSFTFFGRTISSLVTSTNQVVYFGTPRDETDFLSGKTFISALSVMHADWVQNEGIRYLQKSDGSAVIGLKGSLYGLSDIGSVRSVVVVKASGVIEVHSAISSDLHDILGSDAKIILTSPTGENYQQRVGTRSGVRFTPLCGSTPGSDELKVKKVKVAVNNDKLKISLKGTGTGRISLKFSVSGKSCSGQSSTNLRNGRGSKSFKLSSSLLNRVSIRVRAGGATGAVKVRAQSSQRVSKKSIQQACSKLAK